MELVLNELGWPFRDESLERGPGSKCYVAPAPNSYGVRVYPDTIAKWDAIPIESLPMYLGQTFWQNKGYGLRVIDHVILPYLHKRMELGV